MFSMLHPLDEVTPLICRTGGTSATAKVSFVTETSQQIVFTSKEPSLVVTYDKILSAHAVWTLRMAKAEVGLYDRFSKPMFNLWALFQFRSGRKIWLKKS